MNDEEKNNLEKLQKDLSVEHLSDQEILEMWKAPAIQQIKNGLSNYKLENYLISKGISKKYAPTGVKLLKEEAQVEISRSGGKDSLGHLLTKMFQSMTSMFKFKR